VRVKTSLLTTCVLAGLTAVNLPASTIFGIFTVDGNISVTENTIDFSTTGCASCVPPIASVPQEANVGSEGSLTGTFAADNLGGTVITMTDLNNVSEPTGIPPGFPVPDADFITFLSAPVGFPTLTLTGIYAGSGGSAGCPPPFSPTSVGQTCTEPGSPFTLTNNAGGTSTGSFVFAGTTSDGGTWVGDFSANFTVPYQIELAILASGAPVNDTFSGTIVVTPGVTTPEANSGVMLASGLALVLLSLGSRRFSRRRQQQ
jgi:hypothetical protein